MRALVKTEPTVGYEYKTNWPIRQPGECATVKCCRFHWKWSVNDLPKEMTNVWSKWNMCQSVEQIFHSGSGTRWLKRCWIWIMDRLDSQKSTLKIFFSWINRILDFLLFPVTRSWEKLQWSKIPKSIQIWKLVNGSLLTIIFIATNVTCALKVLVTCAQFLTIMVLVVVLIKARLTNWYLLLIGWEHKLVKNFTKNQFDNQS